MQNYTTFEKIDNEFNIIVSLESIEETLLTKGSLTIDTALECDETFGDGRFLEIYYRHGGNANRHRLAVEGIITSVMESIGKLLKMLWNAFATIIKVTTFGAVDVTIGFGGSSGGSGGGSSSGGGSLPTVVNPATVAKAQAVVKDNFHDLIHSNTAFINYLKAAISKAQSASSDKKAAFQDMIHERLEHFLTKSLSAREAAIIYDKEVTKFYQTIFERNGSFARLADDINQYSHNLQGSVLQISTCMIEVKKHQDKIQKLFENLEKVSDVYRQMGLSDKTGKIVVASALFDAAEKLPEDEKDRALELLNNYKFEQEATTFKEKIDFFEKLQDTENTKKINEGLDSFKTTFNEHFNTAKDIDVSVESNLSSYGDQFKYIFDNVTHAKDAFIKGFIPGELIGSIEKSSKYSQRQIENIEKVKEENINIIQVHYEGETSSYYRDLLKTMVALFRSEVMVYRKAINDCLEPYKKACWDALTLLEKTEREKTSILLSIHKQASVIGYDDIGAYHSLMDKTKETLEVLKKVKNEL